MKNQTKIYLYVAVIAIFVGFMLYWWGKKKSTIQQAPLPNELPSMSSLTTAEAAKVREITMQLHNEMKGISYYRKNAPFQALADLGDKLFTAAYNDFNNLYGAEGAGTLKDWINDESIFNVSWLLGGIASSQQAFINIRKKINERFAKLNLI